MDSNDITGYSGEKYQDTFGELNCGEVAGSPIDRNGDGWGADAFDAPEHFLGLHPLNGELGEGHYSDTSPTPSLTTTVTSPASDADSAMSEAHGASPPAEDVQMQIHGDGRIALLPVEEAPVDGDERDGASTLEYEAPEADYDKFLGEFWAMLDATWSSSQQPSETAPQAPAPFGVNCLRDAPTAADALAPAYADEYDDDSDEDQRMGDMTIDVNDPALYALDDQDALAAVLESNHYSSAGPTPADTVHEGNAEGEQQLHDSAAKKTAKKTKAEKGKAKAKDGGTSLKKFWDTIKDTFNGTAQEREACEDMANGGGAISTKKASCLWPRCTTPVGAKSARDRHVVDLHLGGMKFSCDYCDHTRGRKDAVDRHMKKCKARAQASAPVAGPSNAVAGPSRAAARRSNAVAGPSRVQQMEEQEDESEAADEAVNAGSKRRRADDGDREGKKKARGG